MGEARNIKKEKKDKKDKKNKKKRSLPKPAAILGPAYDWWNNPEDDIYNEIYRDKV